MTVIGDQLLQPEEGWKRYDDADLNFRYTGSWSTITNTSHYNGTMHEAARGVSGMSVSFYFKGTSLRVISSMQDSTYRARDLTISIDGITETYSEVHPTNSLVTQALAYEKTDLEDKEHHVVITAGTTGTYRMNFDAIDINNDGTLLPHPREIGEILKTPDPGWKRIDDSDSRIMYGGAWNTYTNNSYSGGTIHESRVSGTTAEFSFLGTKFRIISFRDLSGYRATDIKISVDGGATEIYSEVGNRGDYNALVYQKEGLEYGYHTVRITSGTVSAYKIYLDAIDIEETAEFFSPLPATTGTLKSKVSEMKVGDYIICGMYVNPFRQLQNLGDKDTIHSGIFSTPIPFTNGGLKYSTSTLYRGHFYLIKVDKGLLVADRVVFSGQNATWSSLSNTTVTLDGVTVVNNLIDGTSFEKGSVNFGSETSPGDFKNIKGVVRSLTGGIAYRDKYDNIRSINDKYGAYPANNEWDKYIKNFPSDMIKEGYSLNDVFHCVRDDKDAPLYTICRETPYLGVPNINGSAATASDRTMRTEWLSGDSGFSHLPATNGDYSGFRPVIEYEE
jgi:Carbohydrate esterase 2 N-terminal